MDSKALLAYCLGRPGALEDYPFGPEVIVIKVFSKMFALFSRRNNQENVAVKCDPDFAELLHLQYTGVTPGYHLNKRHWNTVLLDGSVPEEEIRQMIDHSYALVVKSLARYQRARLNEQHDSNNIVDTPCG